MPLQQQQQQEQLMNVDAVLRLFDSYWFELEIFGKDSNHPYPSLVSSNSTPETFPTKNLEQVRDNFSKFSRVPTILVRSLSDQLSTQSSFKSGSLSPNSVLTQRKLETITSGEEIMEHGKEYDISSAYSSSSSPVRVNKYGGKRKKIGASSKSLSQLEFEELKGFMDLGFVFSEEDKNSGLVSIIPGLQRLGNNNNNNKDGEEESTRDDTKSEASRPYLSEAWEYWDEKRKENPLMNWKVPSLGNETDIKDSLRWWAHTVASTVR